MRYKITVCVLHICTRYSLSMSNMPAETRGVLVLLASQSYSAFSGLNSSLLWAARRVPAKHLALAGTDTPSTQCSHSFYPGQPLQG